MTASIGNKPTSQAKWRKRNLQADWAHVATRSALRRGLLVRQSCEVCGADKTDAHHPDYDRPLVVKWLCRKHHVAVHRVAKSADGKATQSTAVPEKE